MKKFLFTTFVTLNAVVFIGCVAATQAPPPPTSELLITATPTVFVTKPNLKPTLETLPTRAQPGAPSPQPSPTMDTIATPANQTPVADDTLVKLISDAKGDLTTRASVSPDAIQVKSAQAVEWSDASLGCPRRGVMYIQVMTPGYLIVLQAAGKEWEYHANRDAVTWCDK